MRIALVTTDLPRVLDEDLDRPALARALEGRGLDFEHTPWHDASVGWESFDLAVLRSPWDYPERLDEFGKWLDRASRRVAVENAPALVRWNLDKRYLDELASEGVSVVPTAFAADERSLDDALRSAGGGEVVVKPHISAGSRDTGRYAADDPRARRLGEHILASSKIAMVQPAIPSVASRGERALVFIGGSFSHAYEKGPILARGGGFVHGEYREDVSLIDPSAAQLSLARSCAERVTDRAQSLGARGGPLYARYDLVTLEDGREALLEAELFEPALGLQIAPRAAAERLAAEIETRATR